MKAVDTGREPVTLTAMEQFVEQGIVNLLKKKLL